MNKEIIKLIEQRLEKGNEELNVNDDRDWLQKALEEQLDGIIYITAKLLKLKKDNDKYLASNSTMWNQLLEKAGEIEDYANDIQAMSEDLRNYVNDIC
mgnify:FL=1